MLVTKPGKQAALAYVYRCRGMSPGNFPRVETPGCDPRKAERSNDKDEHGASVERDCLVPITNSRNENSLPLLGIGSVIPEAVPDGRALTPGPGLKNTTRAIAMRISLMNDRQAAS